MSIASPGSGSSTAEANSSDLSTLADVLKAGSIIAGTEAGSEKANSATTLDEILRQRLAKFEGLVAHGLKLEDLDLAELELLTAKESLWVIEHVENALRTNQSELPPAESRANPPSLADASQPPAGAAVPLLGQRDLAQVRIHLSIAFKWGTELLLNRILPTLPNKRSPKLPPGAQYVDLTTACEDYVSLWKMLERLFEIVSLGSSESRQISNSVVGTTLLNKHVTDFLRPMICLGWLPDELRGDLPAYGEMIRPFVMRFLQCLQPSQTILSLGQVLANTVALPLYMHKICAQLLCNQLLRPHGVPGLFSALFGEDASVTDAPVEKLDRVSRVLCAPPQNVPRIDYFSVIIPRTIHLLTPSMESYTPPAHKRAAAFSLSSMLSSSKPRDIQQLVVSWVLHDPFIPPILLSEIPSHQNLSEAEVNALEASAKALPLSAADAFHTLSRIVAGADPSPTVMAAILGPIVPQLFSLSDYLANSATADPSMKETVLNVLAIWASAAAKEDVTDALMKVVDGEGYDWEIDEAGELHVVHKSKAAPTFTLAELAQIQEDNLDTDSNPLHLRPDPGRFTAFLKNLDRPDITFQVFLRILDYHREAEADEDGDPIRKLLIFKLFYNIQKLTLEAAPRESATKLGEPSYILTFIKHALGGKSGGKSKSNKLFGNGSLSLDSLRIVDDDDEGNSRTGGDSDDEDEAPGLEGVHKSDHLTVTAINLLLSLLEGHPDLSPRTEPSINEIYALLEPLSATGSDAVRPLAQEARQVITARLAAEASSSSSSAAKPDEAKSANGAPEEAQETYQRALKLLQDPLLPVRAHGLLLLRELVAPKKEPPKKKGKKGKRGSRPGSSSGAGSVIQGQKINPPSVDAAYIPAILGIFLESIQDEDSYIFLNAVQGLSAMVDGFGKDVLKGIVDVYMKGLSGIGGTTLTQKDVDVRVRVGQALEQVIQRCGGTLGFHVDIIVPSLFSVVRASHLPTTVRVSAVSLLGQCVETNAVAMAAYIIDLVSAMVDLVQIESVPLQALPGEDKNNIHHEGEMGDAVQSGESDAADVRGKMNGTASGKAKGRGKAGRSKVNNEKEEKGAGAQREEEKVRERTMDSNPTDANPKFPPLRRAALHFLALLVRSTTARIYDLGDDGAFGLPDALMERGRTVLGYIAATDRDEVVRIMARETVEEIDELKNAIYGI